MPCECELDLSRRWVKVRAWGLVTYAEVMAARRKFTADPDFQPDFFQLYDVREVTRASLTAIEVVELAKAPIFAPTSRRACITTNGETYGILRMFQIYRALNNGQEQIRLFKSIDDAEAWLAADPALPYEF
jgi:hypothetical protein